MPDGALVVKTNTCHYLQFVNISVEFTNEVASNFRNCVRAYWIELSFLVYLSLYLSIHLRRRRMENYRPQLLFQALHGLTYISNTFYIDLKRVRRHLERVSHLRLRRKVVNEIQIPQLLH
jgi:hypothetical protein